MVLATIVVYAQPDQELASIVTALAGQRHRPLELLVVSNEPGRDLSWLAGLAEGTGAGAERPPTGCEVLEAERNLGWTGAVNLALEEAAARGVQYLLMLNTDVRLLSDDVISPLLSALRLEGTGFASPAIASWPETELVWYRGATVSRPSWATRHPGIGERYRGPSRGVVPIEVGCSCCMLASTQAMRRLGGFDERLFMYFEDADLAVRARAAGIATVLVDEPLVAHHPAHRRRGSIPSYYFGRNPFLLVAKHESGWPRVKGTGAATLRALHYGTRCSSLDALAAMAKGVVSGMSAVVRGAFSDSPAPAESRRGPR